MNTFHTVAGHTHTDLSREEIKVKIREMCNIFGLTVLRDPQSVFEYSSAVTEWWGEQLQT
jgi:hypothetical protein